MLRWNGDKWSRVATPDPSSEDNELYGVAAVSPSDVWSVGYELEKSSRSTTRSSSIGTGPRGSGSRRRRQPASVSCLGSPPRRRTTCGPSAMCTTATIRAMHPFCCTGTGRPGDGSPSASPGSTWRISSVCRSPRRLTPGPLAAGPAWAQAGTARPTHSRFTGTDMPGATFQAQARRAKLTRTPLAGSPSPDRRQSQLALAPTRRREAHL